MPNPDTVVIHDTRATVYLNQNMVQYDVDEQLIVLGHSTKDIVTALKKKFEVLEDHKANLIKEGLSSMDIKNLYAAEIKKKLGKKGEKDSSYSDLYKYLNSVLNVENKVTVQNVDAAPAPAKRAEKKELAPLFGDAPLFDIESAVKKQRSNSTATNKKKVRFAPVNKDISTTKKVATVQAVQTSLSADSSSQIQEQEQAESEKQAKLFPRIRDAVIDLFQIFKGFFSKLGKKEDNAENALDAAKVASNSATQPTTFKSVAGSTNTIVSSLNANPPKAEASTKFSRNPNADSEEIVAWNKIVSNYNVKYNKNVAEDNDSLEFQNSDEGVAFFREQAENGLVFYVQQGSDDFYVISVGKSVISGDLEKIHFRLNTMNDRKPNDPDIKSAMQRAGIEISNEVKSTNVEVAEEEEEEGLVRNGTMNNKS